jgi:hypothetical protein
MIRREIDQDGNSILGKISNRCKETDCNKFGRKGCGKAEID